MELAVLGPDYVPTRQALHRVAVHIVARARIEATGRFGLRVSPGGFATPAIGSAVERLRVSGGYLIRERAGVEGSSSTVVPLDGSTISGLAAFAEVDLSEELSVGDDTPALTDVDAPLAVDAVAARQVAEWFTFVNAVLDEVIAMSHTLADPSAVQLWPEHFDVALNLAPTPERRTNVGGSAGDATHASPYLYVGPWNDDRPGDPAYWNTSFGAILTYEDLMATPAPLEAAIAFVHQGLELLRG